MNQDILAGKWKQMRGQVKQWWGKLTDDDLDRIDGTMDKLAGTLQERYGWERDEVDREVKKHFEQDEPERPSRRKLAQTQSGGASRTRTPPLVGGRPAKTPSLSPV